MKRNVKEGEDTGKMVELRNNAKMFLLENPNYFGIQDKENKFLQEFQPVIDLLSNTSFEELTCSKCVILHTANVPKTKRYHCITFTF